MGTGGSTVTTMRDVLKDFAEDLHEISQVDEKGKVYRFDDDENEIIDDYIEIIKTRLIG